MSSIHKSVLFEETIEGMKLKNGSIVVDATLGGGGHSLEILERIMPDGKLIAFDQDGRAVEAFRKKIDADARLREYGEKIILINENFEKIKECLEDLEIAGVDAIMADLGISSDQLEDEDLGISFRFDSPLDMRLDRKRELTAEKVVNGYSEEELTKVLREFGDEKYAKSIARGICKAREEKRITKTKELISIIEGSVPGMYRRGKIHFATKTFQALRIEVNSELEVLKKLVADGTEALLKKGRLAIITFHSGEDRIVKNLFRELSRGCVCPPELPICRCGREPIAKLVTRKAIVPTEKEVEENPRARSAKLRIIEKI
ncbi:MAG: Ribosomal RNA small subunit methyltransferase H [Candidatus Moranbacteria bacterium GW2011_GWE1_49_15]|nr:MAG: Ribosomal RNA small subunit methyltransferase H [Candidatus Moranbacteria bacterium GW2011_GWE2_47_10]KKW06739.1 MAG: Ribosomal RNA small subunit methyltransferase H [Candidatus Moranbacteria bacterium GW2011_GWE1_49_15]HBP00781.1 16S rRNA (cytosine(1402)-N(4))-methyltransferase [Candidatus Moranbacteria bacterium]